VVRIESNTTLLVPGSSKLIAEFFDYSINTILFQRGVYPAEDFSPVKKYGLPMLVSTDEDVKKYIKKIMGQLNRWMAAGQISKLVVVIAEKETGEAVERWQFDVQMLATSTAKTAAAPAPAKDSAKGGDENSAAAAAAEKASAEAQKQKEEAQIQAEIQALFRQITASVTFLPSLDAGAHTFNVLVYADAESEVPVEWGDSDAREVVGGEKVQLRSFSTNSHRVEAVVSYRLAD
jgi:mitotic spindle assembly checkpoint protein MAD2